MTILACGQCWLGIAQVIGFVIIASGSFFNYIKNFTRKGK